jgi:hypothetical protein
MSCPSHPCRKLIEQNECPEDVAALLNVSRATLYRVLAG